MFCLILKSRARAGIIRDGLIVLWSFVFASRPNEISTIEADCLLYKISIIVNPFELVKSQIEKSPVEYNKAGNILKFFARI